MAGTTRHGTALTALVEAGEERRSKLMSKSLHMAGWDGALDDLVEQHVVERLAPDVPGKQWQIVANSDKQWQPVSPVSGRG